MNTKLHAAPSTRHYRTAQSGDTSIAIGSDIGRQRDTQQDAFLALGDNDTRGNGVLLLVADGMGGEDGGEDASWTIVDIFTNYYASERERSESALEAMARCIHNANDDILLKAQNTQRKGMGSTVVAIALEAERGYIAHVGDSRAYVLDDTGFRQITTDHSRVQRLVQEGILTPEQAAEHPDAHVLSQAVGRPNIVVDHNTPEGIPRKNTLFMLCSDGLTGMLPDSVIEHALRGYGPAKALEELMNLANDLDSSDNISIAIASERKPNPAYIKEFQAEKKALLRTEAPSDPTTGPEPTNRRSRTLKALLIPRKPILVALFLALIIFGIIWLRSAPPKPEIPMPEGPAHTVEENGASPNIPTHGEPPSGSKTAPDTQGAQDSTGSGAFEPSQKELNIPENNPDVSPRNIEEKMPKSPLNDSENSAPVAP